ncbi:MAG: hypothetical protein FD126_3435, partial [Elusimicrobia bacterium]
MAAHTVPMLLLAVLLALGNPASGQGFVSPDVRGKLGPAVGKRPTDAPAPPE